MRDVELHVPPDVQYVGLVRLVVTAGARQAGMTNERIEDLKIAVSEATTNAIQAHRREQADGPITLQFGSASTDQFHVTILGAGYIPTGVDGSESTAAGERNLGLTLIRGLADVVDFQGPTTKASVHMRFTVGLTPPAANVDSL
ncbi:MAG TPA: ATP-binding protein [Egibacteraceae bacterium]|nr:ATP-binding protein [Egibacteraceae bacterium]